jgi:hypothetical protein
VLRSLSDSPPHLDQSAVSTALYPATTGLLAEKYRIHPIYSSWRFFDFRSEKFSLAPIHAQASLTHILFGYVMVDLVLQDFRDQSGEDLSQILYDEKVKMFSEGKFHFNNEGRRSLGFEAAPRRMVPSEKRRRKTC